MSISPFESNNGHLPGSPIVGFSPPTVSPGSGSKGRRLGKDLTRGRAKPPDPSQSSRKDKEIIGQGADLTKYMRKSGA